MWNFLNIVLWWNIYSLTVISPFALYFLYDEFLDRWNTDYVIFEYKPNKWFVLENGLFFYGRNLEYLFGRLYWDSNCLFLNDLSKHSQCYFNSLEEAKKALYEVEGWDKSKLKIQEINSKLRNA